MTFLTGIRDLSVFVVEPSAAQSQFIAAQLKSAGVMLTKVFKDGTSALKAMHEHLPDVVVSSMHLPDMTGGDLVARMRGSEETRNIAFILISSETNPHYLEPVRQNGSSAILGKPFTLAQLKQALATSLDFLKPDSGKIEAGDDIDLETIRVLLVDDSRTARAFMRRVLENLGIRNFAEAENGKQAAGLIQQHYFDLVVTDYNMPEMDGRELTEYIRTQSWQSTVPILMVSSESNQSRLAAVEQAGVSGVCDKPFEPAVVRKLLAKMLKAD
ncbi:MAG: response regulator [Gallionellaceae bacterium]|jgi:two-component system chemotaxis response regulator CheY|nr:response regulator [Gallionellaceae bacterium]